MARQRSLDFGGEQLAALWKQVPQRHRKQAVLLLARLITTAACREPKRKGDTR